VLGCWLAILMLATEPEGKPSRLADIGPAPQTELVDSAGGRCDLAKLRGKIVLVSFVYTKCNGACPATTQTLVGIQRALRDAKLWANSVEFVSITLDPTRDSPGVLDHYARLFGADLAGWHFLTGERSTVEAVINAWGIWVKRNPDGVIDHSSRVFLLDQQGREREIYNLEWLKTASVVEDVQELLRESAERLKRAAH
jgi:protein SCO1/2